MHLLDEQISLTDGNVFFFIQKTQILDRRKKLTIDLSFSGCGEEVKRGSHTSGD